MTGNRRLATLPAAALAVALAACSPTPAPTAAPTASASTPAPDYRQPGAARAVLNELQSASGQAEAIKADVTQTTATLVVVNNGTAETWQLRNGKPTKVDGDTQYVGQTAFKLTDYALDDVGALFRAASGVSESSTQQELQVVEYSAGRVYMTVTTMPESQTVFFTREGQQVPTLVFTTADGLAAGLRDAIDNRPLAYAITISPTTGVTVDVPDKPTGYLRTVRTAKYPARTELHTDKPVSQLTFDPALVDPQVLATLVGRYTGIKESPVSFAIDRRDGLADPLIRATADGKTYVCDLRGTDITGVVKK